MIDVFHQDPVAKLDYAIDWSAWLSEGESVTTAQWQVPIGIRGTAQTINAGAVTRIWLEAAGAKAGSKHRISCVITTSAGRTTKQSFLLQLEDC